MLVYKHFFDRLTSSFLCPSSGLISQWLCLRLWATWRGQPWKRRSIVWPLCWTPPKSWATPKAWARPSTSCGSTSATWVRKEETFSPKSYFQIQLVRSNLRFLPQFGSIVWHLHRQQFIVLRSEPFRGPDSLKPCWYYCVAPPRCSPGGSADPYWPTLSRNSQRCHARLQEPRHSGDGTFKQTARLRGVVLG